MKFLSYDDSVTTGLFIVRASETELEVYEACLDYIAQNIPENIMKSVAAGATQEEVIGLRDSLRYVIIKNYKNYNIELPEKARDWDIDYLEYECFEKQLFLSESRFTIGKNGNEQVIESTDVHPFWVVTDDPDLSRAARDVVDENGVLLYHENLEPGLNGFWVEAKDLGVGDVFLGANGELSTLTNIVRVEQSGGVAVFNFTVDGNHNYFILAKDFDYGQSCVLVHNAKCRQTTNQQTTGWGNIGSHEKMDADTALERGLDWLGHDYREVGLPGSGVFRSNIYPDRQFRMGPTDLDPLGHGQPWGGAHVHFEVIGPRGTKIENLHIYIQQRKTRMAWRSNVTKSISQNESLAYIILSNESQMKGYYVFKFNLNGEVLFGDDYYFSLEEAKFHCKEIYEIAEDAWYECPNPDWNSIKPAQDQQSSKASLSECRSTIGKRGIKQPSR